MSTDAQVTMNSEDRFQTIEEFKELGNEYRYRDQMMVQEFGLSMVSIGVVASTIWMARPTISTVIAQAIVVSYLFILAAHLFNINEDRRAVLERREALRQILGFAPSHLGAGGKRWSIPNLMIRFVRMLMLAWLFWGWVNLMQLLGVKFS